MKDGAVEPRRGVQWLVAVLAAALLAAPAAAVDPPHWGAGMDCASCHTGHNAPGMTLTSVAGNVNLCQSCHNPSGAASALPINSADMAQLGKSGISHGYGVPAVSGSIGTQLPTNPEMNARVYSGMIVCSTCHDQHANLAAHHGRSRISGATRMTTLGSTGSVTPGGAYTGSTGVAYLIEVTVADTSFRYSKDGGTSWFPDKPLTVGTPIALDSGVTLTFASGTYAVGERWRFTAAYPFLRVALDTGDNASGERFCRDCHRAWAMDNTAVETYDGSMKSHPVGVALGSNGRGWDRATPLDGNGTVQGRGGDGNVSNDYRLDGTGLVQCTTCHGVHHADSNTQTEDAP